MSIEQRFDISLIASLALKEKQIQQNYRPIIAVHKWFARRPGTLFRGLLLSEFLDERLDETYFNGHDFAGWARPTGVLVAGILAARRAPFPVVVIAAAGVTALLRLAGVA